MFTFSLKATMCAWQLSIGTNSQQQKPETEKKRKTCKPTTWPKLFLGSLLSKSVHSWTELCTSQQVESGKIQWSHTPNIPACGSGIVKCWNDPFYLYWWLKFKHLQPGQGPRDNLNPSKTKLRSSKTLNPAVWLRHSLLGVSSANKKQQYLEEKLSCSCRTAGKLKKCHRHQASKWPEHIVTD